MGVGTLRRTTMIPRSRAAAAESTTTARPLTWRSVAAAAAVVLSVPVAALAASYPAVTGALVAGAVLSSLTRPVVGAIRARLRPSRPPAPGERVDRT